MSVSSVLSAINNLFVNIFELFSGLKSKVVPEKTKYEREEGDYPKIMLHKYSLEMCGKIKEAKSFNYEKIRAMKFVDQSVNKIKWRGTTVAEVLKQVGLKKGAKRVVFHCADGSKRSKLIVDCRRSLLIYMKNRIPLPKVEGFPLALLGDARIKWITKLEIR